MLSDNKNTDILAWLKKNYLNLIIVAFASYLLLTFLAPIMMKMGFTFIGERIYLLFSNLCHQYAHRSWFLFGRQSYYPLENNTGLLSVYDAFNVQKQNIEFSRTIIGDELNGFKIAICQRDVALYGAFLIFSIIFLFFQKRIKRISFSLWILLAVLPIGIDGTWQLISSISWLDFINISHESTPLLRSITGAMFGFFSGWFLLPAIEEVK